MRKITFILLTISVGLFMQKGCGKKKGCDCPVWDTPEESAHPVSISEENRN
jgi:hypothetical protein